MRGTLAVITAVLAAGVAIYIAGSIFDALIPVVLSDVSGDLASNVTFIETVTVAVVPVVFVVGMATWALIWYLRRERRVGGRRY